MLFKNLKKLNLFLCLIVCFTLVTNISFAGEDLDRALAANNENDSEIIQKDFDNELESLLREIELDETLSLDDKIVLRKNTMELSKAQRNLERIIELMEDNAVTQEDYDTAMYDFEQAYKQFNETLETIKKKYNDKELESSHNSYVNNDYIEDALASLQEIPNDELMSLETPERNSNNKAIESSHNSYANNGYIEDDLAFLQELSNDELMPLVAIMTDRISDELSYQAKTNPKDNLKEIIFELGKYGGNTFANFFRGKGVSYREILEDVCKKQGIQFDRNLSTEDLGALLVEETVANSINRMSSNQKKDFINELKKGMKEDEFKYLLKQTGGMKGLMSSSGKTFANLLFDKISGEEISATSIIFGISDNFGVPVPTSVQLLTSGVADYFGTFGYLVIAAIAVTEIGGPAYRVTVPATTYIECLRIIKHQEKEEIITDNNFLFILGFVLILLLFVLIFFYIKKNNNILKEENKNITNNSKLICPKCNTENNRINSFCTKCHYVFTKENK